MDRVRGDDGAHTARAVSIVLADGYLDVIEYDGAEGDLPPTGVVLGATDITSMRAELMQGGIRCGRPYLTTEPAAPMRNIDEHASNIVSLEDGAHRLGVELSA